VKNTSKIETMNLVYYNGTRVGERDIISLYNGSFLYGINCFEGIRGYWNVMTKRLNFFDLTEHIDRLFNSSNALEFEASITKKELIEEIFRIISENDISECVYLRVTFFIDGESSWSETKNISRVISIRSMKSNLDNKAAMSLAVSSYARISNNIMPPRIKAGANYLNSRYALLEGVKRGFEGAIFLTKDGYISESTGSCIFFIKGNTLITPNVDSDILVGITRNRIISLAQKNYIEVTERKIAIDELPGFEAAFLAGTMIELRQISKIENNIFQLENRLYLQILCFLKNYLYEL